MIRSGPATLDRNPILTSSDRSATRDTFVTTLDNGVRVVAIRLPHLGTASVSVFVRTGSTHERPRHGGISHFVEHMAFKGTHERDGRQINLDAERLGADVNAHTDKDHTAYHMQGMARDAGALIRMLGDIVRNSNFPEAEVEREREVIRQEYLEDEDDPMSTAFRLFDKACFGAHPMGRPVIGSRATIDRMTRADLLGYVQQQYTGANVIVGVAGDIDPDAVARDVAAAFGAMPRGTANTVEPPSHIGGVRTRRLPGSSQSHVVLGFPVPARRDDAHVPSVVAAALFGDGMSSPLMHEIRERRGLVYYAACSADVNELAGQFVVEASTTPEHLDEFFTQVAALLRDHAQTTDPIGLERARNQIAVRSLRALERPFQRLEDAAQDLFVHGRVRPRAEFIEQVEAVTAREVRGVFERMLQARVAVALTGRIGQRGGERVLELLGMRG